MFSDTLPLPPPDTAERSEIDDIDRLLAEFGADPEPSAQADFGSSTFGLMTYGYSESRDSEIIPKSQVS